MTKDEALKLALEALKYPLNQSHENFNVDMAELLAHRAIPAIKEALAQPEQEPVKFEAVWDSGPTNKDYEDAMRLKRLQQLTTPPQRKPLTDEEIDCLWSQSLADTEGETWLPLREFARAIEAAHQIKGKA